MTEDLDEDYFYIGHVNVAGSRAFVAIGERSDGECVLTITSSTEELEAFLSPQQAVAVAKYLLDYATGARQ